VATLLLRLQLLLLLLLVGGRLALRAPHAFDLNLPPPEEEQEQEEASLASTVLGAGEPDTSSLETGPTSSLARSLSSPPQRSRTHSLEPETPAGQANSSRAQQLPKYLDFEQFAAHFARHYDRPEAYLRKSIFLKNGLDVFKWRVAYRLGRAPYLRQINKLSDRSPDELRLLFPAGLPAEFRHWQAGEQVAADRGRARPKSEGAWQAGDGLEAELEEEARLSYAAELSRRQQELEELAKRGPATLETESHGSGEGAGQPALMSEREAERQIGQLLGATAELREAALEELAGAAMESESRGGPTQLVEFPEGGVSGPLLPRPLPWPGAQSSQQFFGQLVASVGTERYEAPQLLWGEEQGWQPIDWSGHECFHRVYDQGPNCGKCYVVAAVTLAEFYKCTERGPGRPTTRRQFSKEFVLDCGERFAPTLMGCAGGSPLDTLRMLAQWGATTIKEWRERKRRNLGLLYEQFGERVAQLEPLQWRCPLTNDELPPQAKLAGTVPLQLNPKPVHPNHWAAALQDGPLVAWVQLPSEGFADYREGVHDGLGCHQSGQFHAMLLVGLGRDPATGRPFWKFRNSFGPDWGQAGHFSMAADVPGACLAGGVRVFREPLDSAG